MTLNKFIKLKRIERGITQARLAEMLGYNIAQSIYNIESGKMNLPNSKLKRLCRALLVDKSTVANILISEYKEKVVKSLNIKCN
jgi:transcriptional regulator with XRE-family HTH domain